MTAFAAQESQCEQTGRPRPRGLSDLALTPSPEVASLEEFRQFFSQFAAKSYLLKVRIPRSPAGKLIDVILLVELLYQAWLLQPSNVDEAYSAPARRTVRMLRLAQRTTCALSKDPVLPSNVRNAMRFISVIAASQDLSLSPILQHKRQRGRPGATELNGVLLKLANEMRRSTGNPQWAFLLNCLQIVVPEIFANASTDHLRMRVRYAERATSV